jgi:hypothetical protein
MSHSRVAAEFARLVASDDVLPDDNEIMNIYVPRMSHVNQPSIPTPPGSVTEADHGHSGSPEQAMVPI